MQLSELQEIADSLGQAVISGKTSSILGFNISSMSITDPIPSPSDPGWIKVRKGKSKNTSLLFKNFLLISYFNPLLFQYNDLESMSF